MPWTPSRFATRSRFRRPAWTGVCPGRRISGQRAAREVRIETREPLDGRRRFRGRLVGFEEDTARVEVDGQSLAIPFSAVAKANTIYQFSRADFARAGKAGDRSA